MTKHTIYLIDKQRKQYACELVRNAPEGFVCEIKERTRSLDQNAMLHKILSVLSKYKEFGQKKRSIEQWKLIMVSGHAVATGHEAEMTLGIEGEIINLRESTAKMGIKRLSSLIEYVLWWCADNEIELNDY